MSLNLINFFFNLINVYQYIANYANHLIVIRKQSIAKLLYFCILEWENKFIIFLKESEQDVFKRISVQY